MDQSGSRHRTQITPLIIDLPDLAHPLSRAISMLLTTVIWCWWLFLWIPAIEIIAAELGHPVAFYVQPTAQSSLALHYLLTQFPLALILLVSLLAINILFGSLLRRVLPVRTGHHPITTSNWPAPIDPAQLSQWQHARILEVEHNDYGQISHARVTSEVSPAKSQP